ncbi:toprim domain-containing protein [Furfurilactobacillus rossiae]
MQREVKCADQIVIATDPDREGENIAYSIFGTYSRRNEEANQKTVAQ